jgi:cellulose synthase/poly-beta-1,6-N-acetylglucosamine synthase-like glycosyltransferase
MQDYIPSSESDDGFEENLSWTVLESQPTLDGPKNVFLDDPYQCSILACVPFFNEEPEDIFMTLHDIYLNQKAVKKHLPKEADKTKPLFHIMIIMDGFNKASPRTIEWLRNIFPGEPWNVLDHLTPDKKESSQTVKWFQDNALDRRDGDFSHQRAPGVITDDKTWVDKNSDPLKEYAVIFQTCDKKKPSNLFPTNVTPPLPKQTKSSYFSKVFVPDTWSCDPCDFEDVPPLVGFEIPLTLIVKCRNRQKHDSHWWSLCPHGFIASYPDARFCFFTDCGTLFDEECMYFMLREFEMDKQKKIGAVTGRQRVMNAKQQGASDEGFIAEFLRHVQRCDFELSFATSVGAFALAGCLPVLPGPCGLYRRETIVSGAGEFYHSFLSMDSNNIGITEANVMIAEDRILSISPFFSKFVKDGSTGELVNYPDMVTTVAPEATFYYESESSIMPLVKQRRRWINGTIAAYLWLLFKKPGLIWSSFNVSIWRKLLIYFLIIVQAYQFLFVFVSPAIFLVLFRTALTALNWKEQLYSDYWFMILMVLYLLFAWASSYKHAADWMFYIAIIVGIFIELLSIAGITRSIVKQALLPDSEFYEQINKTQTKGRPPGYIGNFSYLDIVPFGLLALVAICPLIGALFASPKSFMYVMRSGIYFLLFLPTLVGTFGIYSICNFSDFSWGNRDSTGSADKIGNRLSILVQRGAFFGWFFFALNLCLVFVSLDLFGNVYWRVIGSVAIFGLPLVCILISMVYWICWRCAKTYRSIKGLVFYPTLNLMPPTPEEQQAARLVNADTFR